MKHAIRVFELPIDKLSILENFAIEYENKIYVSLDIQSNQNIKQIILNNSKQLIKEKKYIDCIPIEKDNNHIVKDNIRQNYFKYNKLYDIKYYIHQPYTKDYFKQNMYSDLNYASCFLFPPASNEYLHKGGDLYFINRKNNTVVDNFNFRSCDNKDNFICVMFDERKLQYHFKPVLEGKQLLFYWRLNYNPFLYSLLKKENNISVELILKKLKQDLQKTIDDDNDKQKKIDTLLLLFSQKKNMNERSNIVEKMDYYLESYRDRSFNNIAQVEDSEIENIYFNPKFLSKDKLNIIPLQCFYNVKKNDYYKDNNMESKTSNNEFCNNDGIRENITYINNDDQDNSIETEYMFIKKIIQLYPDAFIQNYTFKLQNGFINYDLNNIEFHYCNNFGDYNDFTIYPKNVPELDEYGQNINHSYDLNSNEITTTNISFMVIPSYIIK